MKPNFSHRRVDACLVAVSGDGPLSDEDFQQLVGALDHGDVTLYLSYSGGETVVSGTQRKKTAEILRRRATRTALVNESKATRGFVAAGRLLGLVDMCVFSKRELSGALDYLRVREPEAVLQALRDCCAELGLTVS